MSIYRPTIETLDEWNAAISACGCCAMPSCPEPTMVCESRSGTATKYGYAPYIQPSGDGGDPIPTLYETSANPSYFSTVGFAALYTGWWYNSGGGYYFESLQNYTINWVSDDGVETGGTTTSDSWNNSNSATFDPISESGSTSDGFSVVQPFFFYYAGASIDTYSEALSDTYSLTTGYTKAADSFEKADVYLYQTSEPAPALQGAGGTADLFKHHFDVTETAKDTLVLSDPFTLADVVSEAEADADAEAWATGACVASTSKLYWPNIEDKDWASLTEDETGFNNAYFPNWGEHGPQVNVAKVRFRFQIPTTHTGDTVEITYDILDTPTTGSPSITVDDATTAWVRPGGPVPTDPDDEYWFTAWIEIAPPTTPGTREVVNIRYTGTPNNPYGVKPQIMGTAYP